MIEETGTEEVSSVAITVTDQGILQEIALSLLVIPSMLTLVVLALLKQETAEEEEKTGTHK